MAFNLNIWFECLFLLFEINICKSWDRFIGGINNMQSFVMHFFKFVGHNTFMWEKPHWWEFHTHFPHDGKGFSSMFICTLETWNYAYYTNDILVVSVEWSSSWSSLCRYGSVVENSAPPLWNTDRFIWQWWTSLSKKFMLNLILLYSHILHSVSCGFCECFEGKLAHTACFSWNTRLFCKRVPTDRGLTSITGRCRSLAQ